MFFTIMKLISTALLLIASLSVEAQSYPISVSEEHEMARRSAEKDIPAFFELGLYCLIYMPGVALEILRTPDFR